MPLAIDLVDKYFWQPIVTDSGYNLINSITYALLAVLGLYLVYKLLEKLEINIDMKFFYALLPFIVLGSLLRAFVDSGVYKISFWNVSPGIYLLITFIFLFSFGISLLVEKYTKLKYWRICSGIGTVAIIFFVIQNYSKLEFANLKFALIIIALALFASFLLWLAAKKAKWMRGANFLPLPAHMLDASATFIAVDFLGMVEKHPVPEFFTNLTGTAAVMFILKLIVLLPAIYLISKEIKNQTLRNFLFIAITTLGLAEGLRNLITIVLV